MEVDYNDLDLTSSVIQELDNKTSLWQGRFSKIEILFIEFLQNDIERLDLEQINNAIEAKSIYKHPDLKMRNPFKNRVLFVWDIMWSILAVYEMLDPAVDSSESTARALLFENIERRLRKIERMRYNVSARFRGDNLPPSGVGPDGHTLRLFEYPKSLNLLDKYAVSIPGHFLVPIVTETIGGFLLRTDFILSPTGKQNPIAAVETIFRPDGPLGWINVEARTYNFCDKVIHILHLEELVGHLKRVYGEVRANSIMVAEANSPYRLRVSIASPHVINGAIGSGKSLDNSTYNDPYFESVDVRLDSLIPGDHIIQRSHPAYVGFVKDPWRLENSLVMRITGINIPSSIETQGHGAGPFGFGTMQAQLVTRFHKALRRAQERVDLYLRGENDPPDLSTPTGLKSALKAIFGKEEPFGNHNVNGVSFPRTMLDAALDAHGDGLQRDDGSPAIPNRYNTSAAKRIGDDFRGVLEFRNEYVQREQGAFWARWVYWSPIPDAQPLTAEQNSEFAEDSGSRPLALNIPYIERIELDDDNNILTLYGYLLSSDRITSVYFVSDPGRTYSYIVDVWVKQGTGTLLVKNGNLNIDIRDIDIISENEIRITLPITWNPPRNFWKPILRTTIGVEIRAETSFTWPNPPEEVVQIREGDDFNVGYYPLFTCSNPESASPLFDQRVEFDLTDHTKWVQKFYREYAPEDTILVIRPRIEDL